MSASEVVAQYEIPEPGQTVIVRQRQWVVADIEDSNIEESITGRKEHLVTLSSLDEDALGEELNVIWEIEPGAVTLERAGLPHLSGFDAPERFDAFLNAVRWGAATNADRNFLQAPFRSGITIEDFQLEPLVRAIDMARANLLIADDVGLGKTIEAGLVIQELLVRHRARSVLIVVPASLQIKWQLEMQEKFGLEFRIVDTAYIKRLRRERGIHANPWSSYPRIITSMDWMKSGEALRMMKDMLPGHASYPRKFDILVVDEAHNVAPSGSTAYAVDSQRTQLIRTISPHFEHKLFLSATPHNGYKASFTSLLELLDDQRFARDVEPDPKQLQSVMVRRLKTDIVDSDGNPVYPTRELKALEIDYTDEETDIHRLLEAFTASRAETLADTRYAYGNEFVHKLLKKRLFSSPAAFHLTFGKHLQTIASGGVRKQNKLDDRILRKKIQQTEEEYANDESFESALAEAAEEAVRGVPPLTNEQEAMAQKLVGWSEQAANKTDAKADALLAWLDTHLKDNGQWNEKRVILFTEYKATHAWLEQILVTHDYGGDQLLSIYGGMDPDEREQVKAAFQADPKESPVRILLATDAASEGIDLQNHCNYLIHIEIPWNPNVMEQRNGRVDRHGQKQDKVFIWHPVGKGFNADQMDAEVDVGRLAGDQEFLARAAFKTNAIREDLGSVGPVIARQIEEAMLGKSTRLDTRVAEETAARTRKLLPSERQLQDKVKRHRERLDDAKQGFHLSPENIEAAVTTGLALAGHSPLKAIDFPGAPKGTVFEVPPLAGSWSRCTVGLEHPHSGERRPITFSPEVYNSSDKMVLAHLNHSLVQMCLQLLRKIVWAPEERRDLHRVALMVMPDAQLEAPVAITWSRLVITGGNHHRLHEELTIAGGVLKHKGFTRIRTLAELDDLVSKAQPCLPNQRLQDVLADRFGRFDDKLLDAVQARSKDRLASLEKSLLKRKEQELADITHLLDELERLITQELNNEVPVQQDWLQEERDQLKRNEKALQARLDRIPSEREEEQRLVEMRYSELNTHTFPVAVMFVVPQSLAEGE